MKYFTADADKPLQFLACGQRTNKKGFGFTGRVYPFTIFLSVLDGVLYFQEDKKKFMVKKGEFIFLLQNHHYECSKYSEGYVSFYWCHFYIPSDMKELNSQENMIDFIKNKHKEQSPFGDFYIFPQTGAMNPYSKLPSLFAQMTDYGCNSLENFRTLQHCCLNLFFLDLTREISVSLVPPGGGGGVPAYPNC
jgi:hypothetical protein